MKKGNKKKLHLSKNGFLITNQYSYLWNEGKQN
jgi:hypothetical protein